MRKRQDSFEVILERARPLSPTVQALELRRSDDRPDPYAEVFVCGMQGMMSTVKRMLREDLGLAPAQVHHAGRPSTFPPPPPRS